MIVFLIYKRMSIYKLQRFAYNYTTYEALMNSFCNTGLATYFCHRYLHILKLHGYMYVHSFKHVQ